MIVVRIAGGLGNQMFRYAAGRRLADTLGVELLLDVSSFGSDHNYRQYGLDVFQINDSFASEKLRKTSCSLKYNILHFFQCDALYHVKEKTFEFDPAILRLGDNIFLDGYWQSERYFSDIAPTIRRCFSFRLPPEDLNAELADKISSVNSVALHVRRGDYLSIPAIAQSHGVCPDAYYTKAVGCISQHIENPHFFIFSDEPKVAVDMLNLKADYTAVHHNSHQCHEDMRLMSLCRHQIIANSSFSWWAAWLNENPEKIVIAPKQWFNQADHNTKDLIPDSWIRL